MLIEGGRSWHPFINLLKSKEAEMNFMMHCTSAPICIDIKKKKENNNKNMAKVPPASKLPK